jgi:phosphate starvation-inducible protein PhoH and related proteins
LIEFNVKLENINPLEFVGINNRKLNLLKNIFTDVKITARGDILKIQGEEAHIETFREKFNSVLDHYSRHESLSEDNLALLLSDDGIMPFTGANPEDVLVHGVNGAQIRAKSANQKRLVDAIYKNDMVFAIGPAGSGKTYTAVALAVRALKNKEVKKIILTRPAVEAGESLGFLPGDMKEKIDPYLRPLYDALGDMIPAAKLTSHFETGVIEIVPLAFMRGRTLDKAFVILDEAQNATEVQMKMFLTRMGPSAKYIITGDLTQIDLPHKVKSGLSQSLDVLKHIDGIEVIYLNTDDVIRHRLVKRIIKAYENYKPHPQFEAVKPPEKDA